MNNSTVTSDSDNLIVVNDLLVRDFLTYRVSAITLAQMGYTTQIIDSRTLANVALEANHQTLLQMSISNNRFCISVEFNQVL
ncbi:MAG: hypothetical protein ACHBN1_12355 [Heteroscytonema crispum UTEX LB 1556]